MPLSKARNKERMRELRSVQPKIEVVQPKSDLPQWVVKPNAYLRGHMSYCPDNDPVQPNEHFEHCPYVDPLLRLEEAE